MLVVSPRRFKVKVSRCAPARSCEHSTATSPRVDLHFPLETVWFCIQTFPHHLVHRTVVSLRDSQQLKLWACYPRTSAAPRRATHKGAQAVEECCPLSPRGGPGPIKCLRWHDFNPQKCPQLQQHFEWHGHAAGMVLGFAIAVQWGSCSEWTSPVLIARAEENISVYGVCGVALGIQD